MFFLGVYLPSELIFIVISIRIISIHYFFSGCARLESGERGLTYKVFRNNLVKIFSI